MEVRLKLSAECSAFAVSRSQHVCLDPLDLSLKSDIYVFAHHFLVLLQYVEFSCPILTSIPFFSAPAILIIGVCVGNCIGNDP